MKCQRWRGWHGNAPTVAKTEKDRAPHDQTYGEGKRGPNLTRFRQTRACNLTRFRQIRACSPGACRESIPNCSLGIRLDLPAGASR